MVIERFRNGDARAVYERFEKRGRMMPPGLEYVDSWTDVDLSRCFQIVRADHPRLLDEWAAHWSDLVDLEFVEIISGKEAGQRVLNG
jgi:hypothetical protein